MRSSHRIGPVANWKFYPSPGSKIEICSLKAEHEPIPDICRLFYKTAIQGQDILSSVDHKGKCNVHVCSDDY